MIAWSREKRSQKTPRRRTQPLEGPAFGRGAPGPQRRRLRSHRRLWQGSDPGPRGWIQTRERLRRLELRGGQSLLRRRAPSGAQGRFVQAPRRRTLRPRGTRALRLGAFGRLGIPRAHLAPQPRRCARNRPRRSRAPKRRRPEGTARRRARRSGCRGATGRQGKRPAAGRPRSLFQGRRPGQTPGSVAARRRAAARPAPRAPVRRAPRLRETSGGPARESRDAGKSDARKSRGSGKSGGAGRARQAAAAAEQTQRRRPSPLPSCRREGAQSQDQSPPWLRGSRRRPRRRGGRRHEIRSRQNQ